MSELETSATIASIAARLVQGISPLADEEALKSLRIACRDISDADFEERTLPAIEAILAPYIDDVKRVAGSALTQREHHTDEDDGLGLQVNLIDVFSAWGEREARDTAMLIDLCLGAALSQLLPFHDADNLYPCEIEITGKMLEDLAGSGRIVRLQPEPNVWRVRLMPAENGNPLNEEWGKLGWIRRHISAFANYHSINETEAEAQDYVESSKWHEERRRLGDKLLSLMADDGRRLNDPERVKAPGENAPEKQNDDQPLSSDNSEPSGDLHRDSQDGFGDDGS